MRMWTASMLVVALTSGLLGEGARAASYQKIDGTIVDPILDRLGNVHPYAGPDLRPGMTWQGGSLRNADLADANLRGSTLSDADFVDSQLSGADLGNSELSRIHLTGSVLAGASLANSNLRECFLGSADLSGANVMSANLRRCSLNSAILSGADLTGADLTRADLFAAIVTGTIFTNAYYWDTTFPVGFDPTIAGMVTGPIVINNGLAPPNPENLILSFDVPYIVNNAWCNALIQYPCLSPGASTTVAGPSQPVYDSFQQVNVYETSSFSGFVYGLIAHDQSQAEVTLNGSSNGVSARDQSTVIAHGQGSNPDCSSAGASDDANLLVTGGCWTGVGAADRSRVVYSGGGADGSDIEVRGEALLDVSGSAYDLWVEERGTAILRPYSEILLGIRVRPQATLLVEGGGHFERAGTFEVMGTLRMTGGGTGETGVRVLGYGDISGGIFDASPEPYDEPPYGSIPGPWNFLAEQSGLIELSGATFGEFVSLGARDSSRIRIFGDQFVAAGQPVTFGSLPASNGSLSGTLASGDPINNPFAHRGADCGGQPCTGRILVLSPGIDWDKDAVPNPFDNCAEEPNADQADLDTDGTGDVCFAPVDLDRDSFIDALDNCRVDANPDQADTDIDGVGDACERNLIFWADKGLEGCTTPPKRLPYEMVSTDLGNGDVIDRSEQPCDCFGIEYPVTPGTASVRFLHRTESGFVEEYCENVAPYALGLGPNQPICADGLDEDGLHQVMATPYDAPGCEAGGGNALPSSIRSFTIAAPEPGLAVMIEAGVLGLIGLSRGTARRESRALTAI
jgi:hypothetical protein